MLVTHEAEIAQHAHRVIHLLDGRINTDEKVDNRIVPEAV